MTPASRPPAPDSAEERLRWDASALRRRLLYSRHQPDVWLRIVQSVGPQRAQKWKPIDMSSNPYAQGWGQLSALYDDEPDVLGPHPDVIESVAESGWWALMQRGQRDTLGLGELLQLCDLDDDGQPSTHTIWPDLAQVDVDPRRPRVLRAVHWWEADPGDSSRWIQWHIQHRDASGKIDARYWSTDENGKDVDRGAGREGYPWIGPDGPVMPVVLRHRSRTGHTWDPHSYAETVDGALQLGLLYTSYVHALRQASWLQRYMIDVQPVVSEKPDGQSSEVEADPAVVVALERTETGQNPQAGQWQNPVNLEQLIGSIRIYERRLIEQMAGGVEVTRESSDIRSGYSLAVGREERLIQQRRFAPTFRAADRQALQIWSALLSTERRTSYPLTWATRRGASRQDPADIDYQVGIPATAAPGEAA